MAKYITAVHEEQGTITRVKVEVSIEDRQTVVENIEVGRQEYYTRPPQGAGARVHVVRRGAQHFISTDPNEMKRDNLGNLPRF